LVLFFGLGFIFQGRPTQTEALGGKKWWRDHFPIYIGHIFYVTTSSIKWGKFCIF